MSPSRTGYQVRTSATSSQGRRVHRLPRQPAPTSPTHIAVPPDGFHELIACGAVPEAIDEIWEGYDERFYAGGTWTRKGYVGGRVNSTYALGPPMSMARRILCPPSSPTPSASRSAPIKSLCTENDSRRTNNAETVVATTLAIALVLGGSTPAPAAGFDASSMLSTNSSGRWRRTSRMAQERRAAHSLRPAEELASLPSAHLH